MKILEVRCQMSNVSDQQPASGFRLFAFRICLVCCFLFLFSSAFSQAASATLDRDKILLGEQITLELKAENINKRTAPLTSWFSLPDTVNHIEVVKRLQIDTIEINGTTTYLQKITLTSFDSGTWQLPQLKVFLQNNDNKKDSLSTTPLSIEVLPVDVSTLQQYHEMKDIIDVEVKPDYLFLVAIALSVLLLSLAIWFLVKKKKKKETILKPVAERSLFETAIGQLEKLGRDAPPAPQFYTRLDEICRTFIHNQLHIRALQLTSDELMVQLNLYMQPDARISFYQLLRKISAVKFAKYGPEKSANAADIETAKAAIQHIYYHLQRSLSQHAK